VSTFKQLNLANDLKTTKSVLNQLVDVIQSDVSGSSTRRSYQVFVTGGIGPGVTSSLFQTVHDQDFSLQTANAVFDMTVGLYSGSHVVTGSSTGIDSSGKVLFPSTSLMMREKISNYRQFAQLLLGDADSQFVTPFSGESTGAENIDTALFIGFKRLFSRDQIKRESFAMKFYRSASHHAKGGNAGQPSVNKYNLRETSESGSIIYTDAGSASSQKQAFGGPVGDIINSTNTAESVGLAFYQSGIFVFDLEKIISGSEHCFGSISAVTTQAVDGVTGRALLGSDVTHGSNANAKFIPDLMVSASIDDIVDHIASCRFSSGSNTSMTYQNLTNINSSLIFCRATADEFNYSSNPTYVDSSNRIRVIEAGMESTQRSFSYITTIGLYDANDSLLAVAKTSRPIEKNNEKDLTIRIRLDF
tara:strand:+ start:73045 stop:74295 length:1251 start_codon:yes stop_codon:yes gene_type:complete